MGSETRGLSFLVHEDNRLLFIYPFIYSSYVMGIVVSVDLVWEVLSQFVVSSEGRSKVHVPNVYDVSHS